VRLVSVTTSFVGKRPKTRGSRDTRLVGLQDEAFIQHNKESQRCATTTTAPEAWCSNREVDMGDEIEVQVGRTRELDEQARAMLERTHDPSRVLALSDGVFAIIITLLVLAVLPQHHGPSQRPEA
jgi:hypothetical protein